MLKLLLKKEAAFTLVELLLVLTLLGIMLSVAIPAISGISGRQNLEITARSLAIDVRRTRQMAITTGTPHCLQLTVNSTRYDYRIKNCLSAETERLAYPEGVSLSSTTFQISDLMPQLRFNPSGACRGGTAVLINSAQMRLYVIVAPATGRVRISEDPPEHWEVHEGG